MDNKIGSEINILLKILLLLTETLRFNLIAGGREEYADWFINDNPQDQTISKKYNISSLFQPTLENMKLVRDGRISILSNRIFVLSHDLQDDIFGIPGNVFSNPLEMIAERGFPMIRNFNSLINRMKDTGLITKIYRDFLYNKTILDHIRHREGITDVNQITLTLQHLDGAFAVLIFGLLISFVVFLIEVALKSQCFIRNFEKVQRNIGRGFQKLMVKTKRENKSLKLRKRFR